MPRGSRHRLSGTLRRDGRRYILDVDGGGYWFLDMPLLRDARHLIGRAVTIEGTRSGFNLMDVSRISA